MTKDEALREIGLYMNGICALFETPVYITLLVRDVGTQAGQPDLLQHVTIMSDDPHRRLVADLIRDLRTEDCQEVQMRPNG